MVYTGQISKGAFLEGYRIELTGRAMDIINKPLDDALLDRMFDIISPPPKSDPIKFHFTYVRDHKDGVIRFPRLDGTIATKKINLPQTEKRQLLMVLEIFGEQLLKAYDKIVDPRYSV